MIKYYYIDLKKIIIWSLGFCGRQLNNHSEEKISFSNPLMSSPINVLIKLVYKDILFGINSLSI